MWKFKNRVCFYIMCTQGPLHFKFSDVFFSFLFLINLNVVLSLTRLNETELLCLFLGMPSSKMSLQPQHTESPRTTAQSWESESAATFSVELPTLITEYIHSAEPRPTPPTPPTPPRVKGISTVWSFRGLFFFLPDTCQAEGALW